MHEGEIKNFHAFQISNERNFWQFIKNQEWLNFISSVAPSINFIN